jgi:hypothetical protein
MEGTLLNFIESVISEKTNQLQKLIIHELTESEVRLLFELIGINLNGFCRVIDNFGIRHAFKKHGDEKQEFLRGQIAIQTSDFLLIFNIITDYDEISTEVNRIGNMMFRYKKSYPEFILIFAEEIRPGRREIAFQTLYKQKIRKS